MNKKSLPVDPVAFQRGLFNLRTRRFGRVAELLIQRLILASKSRNIFHDLYDDLLHHRIEVKFSTVNAEHDEELTLQNLLRVVENAGTERSVPFRSWDKYIFDANIQQIKISEFDILYYGLFFSDEIVIFKINSDAIKGDSKIYYSDKQHKGNVGEGQFHITNRSLSAHLQKYLYRRITYTEFLSLIK